MASVNVETTNNKWGLTHMVTGSKSAVKNWAKRMEQTSPGRVLVRQDSSGPGDQVTWRVDVDTYSQQPVKEESGGPGILGCIAIGLGIGWLFGG